MIESEQVLEWIGMGEAKARAKGEIKGWMDSLLTVLKTRFPPGVPADLETDIRTAESLELLQNWIDLAIAVDSLGAFRQAAGL